MTRPATIDPRMKPHATRRKTRTLAKSKYMGWLSPRDSPPSSGLESADNNKVRSRKPDSRENTYYKSRMTGPVRAGPYVLLRSIPLSQFLSELRRGAVRGRRDPVFLVSWSLRGESSSSSLRGFVVSHAVDFVAPIRNIGAS